MAQDDGGNGEDEYNLPIHVAGLLVLVVASLAGVCLPIALTRYGFDGKRTELTVLFFKCIGCGIVVSTGFIHTLGEAVENLEGKLGSYESWPYVIAMLAIYLSAVLDFVEARSSATSEAGPPAGVLMGHAKGDGPSLLLESGGLAAEGGHSHYGGDSGGLLECAAGHGHGHGHGHSHGCAGGILDSDGLAAAGHGHSHGIGAHRGHEAAGCWNRATLFEVGILSHSVIIGVDLGLQRNPVALLVALIFHQFFEGFALAQVLLEASQQRAQLIAAVFFFSVTCPAGVGVGIAVHAALGEDYDTHTYDVAVGILDSLAGGILIYMGLAQLLMLWLVNSPALHRAPPATAVLAFLGLGLGLAIMSVVGIWA